MRRRGLAIALGLMLALVVFELLAQAIAFATWRPTETPVRPGQRVALCIGDSFTWGMGTSAPRHAYPAVAEQRVRAAGVDDLTFVNAGWPGRNTRDVLERLGGWLQRLQPALVYVLVGTNDAWSWPVALAPGAEDQVGAERFSLQWRTGRLARLVWAWWSGSSAAARLVGAWEADGVQLDLWSGGDGWLGGDPVRWQASSTTLDLHFADGRAQTAVWRIVDDGLELVAATWPKPLRFQRGFARLGAGASASARERDLVRGLLTPGADPVDAERFAVALRERGVRLTPELWAEATADFAAADRARIAPWRDQLLATDAAPETVCAEHLRRIVQLCRRHGSTPVLLTYPGGVFRRTAIEAVQERIAHELDVELLDLVRPFAVLEQRGERDLWVEDGHCNDRGYAEIGRIVAEHALRSRPR